MKAYDNENKGGKKHTSKVNHSKQQRRRGERRGERACRDLGGSRWGVSSSYRQVQLHLSSALAFKGSGRRSLPLPHIPSYFHTHGKLFI